MIWLEWPSKDVEEALATSQSRNVLSMDPETTRLPSGEYMTAVMMLQCPIRDAMEDPVVTSQSCTELSYDPETNRLPSGENAMAVIM
jgi:hypothetical protein